MKPRLFVFLTLNGLFLFLGIGAGQVPQLIRFQGRVTENGKSLDGVGEFKFSMINGSGDLTFWSNDDSGSAGREPSNAVPILVNDGLFSVTLGDTLLTNMLPVPVSVFTNPAVYLRVWFRPAKPAQKKTFQVLEPDLRFTAVGYAMFCCRCSRWSNHGCEAAF